MKALSIRQPWADLIIQGRKTLELRTWTVRYRGPLAIHASQTVEREACLAHGLDPDLVTTGAAIGVVDLVEIRELDAESYAARRSEHLAEGAWGGGTLYGWRLANPRPLPEPAPMRGRMGLFEATLPGDWKSQRPPQSPPPWTESRPARADFAKAAATSRRPPGTPGAGARQFDLRVLSSAASAPGEPAYRLALYQRSVEPPAEQRGLYEAEPPPTHKTAELGGATLRAVADYVLDALRANGYKPTDLGPNRREPFSLAEESGVRLGLLFLAVRPITKVERIEVIGQGIRAMTSEEAYYWYSKCTGGPAAQRAQRALRVLLAAE
ncbi:MAG: ASCH domain protein [Chloroflexi bacterium ADurb.Bin325]|nr:MAG: ASCH domain protein [Chloroflexi bacterium ADurb.Bin325]